MNANSEIPQQINEVEVQTSSDQDGSILNGPGTDSKSDTPLTQRRSPTVRGYVYFIRVGDRIKIGFSTRPPNRLITLQTAHPDKLEIIGTRQAARDFEGELHEHFKRLKVRGEWFQAKAPLLRYIEENTPEGIARAKQRRADELDRFGPAPERKRGDRATIVQFLTLRRQFGANTPIGNRCSIMIELTDNIEDPEDDAHKKRMQANRAKKGKELMLLLEAAA